MEIVITILVVIIIVILLLAGIIGSVVPAIPGPPIAYVGLLLFHLYFDRIGLTYVIIIGIVVVIVTLLDYYLQIYGVKKAGGGKYAMRGSALGMLLGMIFGFVLGFVGSLFGVLIGAFLGAYLGELLEGLRKGRWLVTNKKGVQLACEKTRINAIKAKQELVGSAKEDGKLLDQNSPENSSGDLSLGTSVSIYKNSELKVTKKKPMKIAFGALWGFIAGTVLKLFTSFFIVYEVLISYF